MVSAAATRYAAYNKGKDVTDMGPLLFGLTALLCGIVWLALLIATQFNAMTISAGLFAALFLTGKAEGSSSPRSSI
jgi:hypothetical protein